MVPLIDRLAELSLADRLRLEERLGALRQSKRQETIVASAASGTDALLSLLQQRLWFVWSEAPASAVYNIAGAAEFRGRLDASLLSAAFSVVVQRHETLRTVFPDLDGQPVQRVEPARAMTLPVVDCRELPVGEREQRVRQMVTEEANAPFDLAHGPLCRFRLFRTAEDRHVLTCVMHHIISDWRSLQLLVHEVTLLYRAFLAGSPSPLPPLPIQYRDFARWQRRWLRDQALEQQLAYWRRQLAGAPACIDLPTDAERPALPGSSGAEQGFEISRETAGALLGLASRSGCTPFAVLLAVYLVLLRHHAAQDDLVVSAPMSCRDRLECEGLIGFFVNTLLLRVDLSGARTFRELLARVQQVVSGGLEHRHLPLDRVIQDIAPVGGSARSSLLEISFSYIEHGGAQTIELPGLAVRSFPIETGIAQFDLNLIVIDNGAGFEGLLQYRSELFAENTMRAFAMDYCALIDQIATTEEIGLQDLDAALGRRNDERRAAAWQRLSASALDRLSAMRADRRAGRRAAGTRRG